MDSEVICKVDLYDKNFNKRRLTKEVGQDRGC